MACEADFLFSWGNADVAKYFIFITREISEISEVCQKILKTLDRGAVDQPEKVNLEVDEDPASLG